MFAFSGKFQKMQLKFGQKKADGFFLQKKAVGSILIRADGLSMVPLVHGIFAAIASFRAAL